VEAIGLPKLDLLGIRALTVLADAAELARRRDPAFRLDAIPLDDPVTGDLLARAETIGVFQCESTGAQRTLTSTEGAHDARPGHGQRLLQARPGAGRHGAGFVMRYRGEASWPSCTRRWSRSWGGPKGC
jgi:hypothetical protein